MGWKGNETAALAGTYATLAELDALSSVYALKARTPLKSAGLRAPKRMASPPTVTLGAAFGASTIAGSTQYSAGNGGTLANWLRLYGCGSATFSTLAGLPNSVAGGNWYSDGNIPTGPQAMWQGEFMIDTTAFELIVCVVTNNSFTYRFWVDGELVTPDAPAVTGSGNNYYHLKVEFSSKALRHIRFEMTGGRLWAVTALPTDSLFAVEEPLGERMVAIGDSYTEATGATGRFDSWAWEVGHRLGLKDVYASGLGGTGYLQTNGSRVKFRDRIAADCIALNPALVIVAGGHNDTGATAGSLTTEAAALFAQLRAGLPSARIVVVSPFAEGNTVTNYRTVRDAVLSGAAGYYDLAIDTLAPTDLWIAGTGNAGAPAGNGNADIFVGSDGAHYTKAGYRYVGGRIAQKIAAAGLA